MTQQVPTPRSAVALELTDNERMRTALGATARTDRLSRSPIDRAHLADHAR